MLQRRKTLPLDDNEGIYVRNIKTGRVRAVIGSTYMLTPDEELWQKELPPDIELFLKRDSLADRLARGKEADGKATTGKREKWKLVTYHVPQNEALQVYDYKAKKSRIIFGPDIVMLEPDEHFTYINRSGSMLMSLFLLAFLTFLSGVQRLTSNKKLLFLSIALLVSYIFVRRFIL